jgi:hypothetical protein
MAMDSGGLPEGAAGVPADGDAEVDAESAVMDLLSEKVPLSLIIDLSSPAGPDSEQILDDEGTPDDPWWEPVP